MNYLDSKIDNVIDGLVQTNKPIHNLRNRMDELERKIDHLINSFADHVTSRFDHWNPEAKIITKSVDDDT